MTESEMQLAPEHAAYLDSIDPRAMQTPSSAVLTREARRAALDRLYAAQLNALLSVEARLEEMRDPGEDDGAEPLKPKFGEQSVADFLARDFPPTRFIYLDILPAHEVTVLMAAPNAGKTFLALEMACQIAAGAARAGRRVFIVEEEGAASALQTRLRRALKASGADPARIGLEWNSGISILERRGVQAIIDAAQGADLIILDSLAALTGGLDENDSAQQSLVAQALHEIKTQTGAAVLALHHMTKEAWKEGETPTLRHLRGHGTLAGRVDTVIALTAGASDREAVRFAVHVVKARDNAHVPARNFSVSMVGESAVFEIEETGPEVVRSKSALKFDSIKSECLFLIRGMGQKGCSKRHIEKNIEGTAVTIRSAVDDLHAAGQIEKNEDDRYVLSGGASGASDCVGDAGDA